MSKASGATARPRRPAAERDLRERRVTLQDIARRAGGVHPSTVSLALRNAPSISPALRQKLHDLAARMGYRRDPWLDAFNARRLNRRPHRLHPLIAFVVDVDPTPALATRPGLGAVWRGAIAAAELLHHRVEVFSIGAGALRPTRLEAILRARAIDAVIWAQLQPGTRPPDWEGTAFSAVKIDGFDWGVPGFTVAGDLRQGVRLAAQKLAARGYARIGLALDATRGRGRNDLLAAGFLVETAGAGRIGDVPPFVIDPRKAARLLPRWLETRQVDAVLADASVLPPAAGWLQHATDRGLGVALVDVTGALAEFAGIAIPHERIGATAVEQVVSLSRANQRGPSESAATTLVPLGWREGRTAPRRRDA
jgi:LacI family transcriptional regulator